MQIRIVNEEGLGRGISRSLRLRRSLDPLRAPQNSGEERDWSQSIYKNNYELNSVRRLVILVAGLILGRLQIHVKYTSFATAKYVLRILGRSEVLRMVPTYSEVFLRGL